MDDPFVVPATGNLVGLRHASFVDIKMDPARLNEILMIFIKAVFGEDAVDQAIHSVDGDWLPEQFKEILMQKLNTDNLRTFSPEWSYPTNLAPYGDDSGRVLNQPSCDDVPQGHVCVKGNQRTNEGVELLKIGEQGDIVRVRIKKNPYFSQVKAPQVGDPAIGQVSRNYVPDFEGFLPLAEWGKGQTNANLLDMINSMKSGPPQTSSGQNEYITVVLLIKDNLGKAEYDPSVKKYLIDFYNNYKERDAHLLTGESSKGDIQRNVIALIQKLDNVLGSLFAQALVEIAAEDNGRAIGLTNGGADAAPASGVELLQGILNGLTGGKELQGEAGAAGLAGTAGEQTLREALSHELSKLLFEGEELKSIKEQVELHGKELNRINDILKEIRQLLGIHDRAGQSGLSEAVGAVGLRQEQAKAQAQIDDLTNQLSTQSSDLEKRYGELSVKYQALESLLSERGGGLFGGGGGGGGGSSFSGAVGELQGAVSDLSGLTTRVTAVEKTLKELEAFVIGELKTIGADMTGSWSTLKDDLVTLTQAVQDRLSYQDQDISRVIHLTDHLSTAIEQLQQRIGTGQVNVTQEQFDMMIQEFTDAIQRGNKEVLDITSKDLEDYKRINDAKFDGLMKKIDAQAAAAAKAQVQAPAPAPAPPGAGKGPVAATQNKPGNSGNNDTSVKIDYHLKEIISLMISKLPLRYRDGDGAKQTLKYFMELEKAHREVPERTVSELKQEFTI